MKTKAPNNSPVAALYIAAKEIVDGTRQAFHQQGQDARELRLPILIHGTDMRITIEAGPKIAARNAIEHAQMGASGKPVEPLVDVTRTIAECRALLAEAAEGLIHGHTIDGQWDDSEPEVKTYYDRHIAAINHLNEVERLV